MGQGFFGFMQTGDKPDRPDEPRLTPTEWVWRKLGIKAKPSGWGNAGTGRPGAQAATFDYPEAPANPIDSSLADVLQNDGEVPADHFLTLPEQTRLLSRLAFWKQWSVLRMAIGDPNWSPAERPEDRRKKLKPVPPESSRSLSLDEIKARLANAQELQQGD